MTPRAATTSASTDRAAYGTNRLWNEVEAAHRWWRHSGEPTLEDWEFIVAPDR
jgi:hypothetical protein